MPPLSLSLSLSLSIFLSPVRNSSSSLARIADFQFSFVDFPDKFNLFFDLVNLHPLSQRC